MDGTERVPRHVYVYVYVHLTDGRSVTVFP